jgi:DNA invertase Pin-like site-specific DNA recombinase
MTAALYIRVSTSEQANRGYSLDAQSDLLKRYCDEHSITVYKLYADEGKSANKALSKRTALLQMVKDAEAKLFDTILFKDITRWSRNSAQYYAVQERLDKCGCSWLAVEQPYLETRTPTGRFTVSVMLGTAQLESENTSQRIRFVIDNMVKNGMVPYSSRLAPLGYKVERIDGVRRLVKNDSEREMVEQMFQHLLDYHNASDTRRFISERFGRNLDPAFLSRTMHNRIYVGEYRGMPNFCEPYLTEVQFSMLQGWTNQFRTARYSSDYMFRGILRCSSCGWTMQGNMVLNRNEPNRVYYRCANHFVRHKCEMNKHARQDLIEKRLLGIIKPAFDKLIYSVSTDSSDKDNSKRIGKLRAKMKRLTEVYIDGSISREQYNQRKTAMQREIDALSRSEHSNLAELQELLNSPWRELYDGLSNEDRGVFWRTIIESIWFDGNDIVSVDFKS